MEEIAPFENYIYRFKEGEPCLLSSKCNRCGYVAFPKRVDCPACMSKECSEEMELSREGTISTYSILHVAPSGGTAPYAVANVKLPEGPEIFSMLCDSDSPETAPRIGARVRVAIGKIREDENGKSVMCYKFKVLAQSPEERC